MTAKERNELLTMFEKIVKLIHSVNRNEIRIEKIRIENLEINK